MGINIKLESWNRIDVVARVRDMSLEHIQWKPLNVITLGQRETDNINRMISISK
jgi:hypothetical protein